MRSVPLTLPAVLAGALLLTACGSQKADSQSGGLSQTQVLPGDSSCGAQPSNTVAVPGTSPLPGDPSELGKDGVKITGLSRGTRHCAEFEVTNPETEPFTYTISFAFLSDSGEALANPRQTVPSVKPGQTVKRTVTAGGLPLDARGKVRVRITKVRSVPTDEAPSTGGPCPSSGMRVHADDDPNAAMGLRALGLYLENCGTRTNRLNGYPQLQLLDEGHKPVDSVKILHGGSAVATGPTGADGMPQPLALKPGERAYANLVWRNTVEAGVGNSEPPRLVQRPGLLRTHGQSIRIEGLFMLYRCYVSDRAVNSPVVVPVNPL